MYKKTYFNIDLDHALFPIFDMFDATLSLRKDERNL